MSDRKKLLSVSCVVLLGLFLACVGCTEKSSDPIAGSGHQDLDQTAQFAHHLVKLVNKRQGLNTPSSIVDYITSTSGSAELWPPSLGLEPDAAAYYKGPRPADGVGLSKGPSKRGIFEREIILSADDSKSLVVAEGYVSGQSEPVYTWKWSVL